MLQRSIVHRYMYYVRAIGQLALKYKWRQRMFLLYR